MKLNIPLRVGLVTGVLSAAFVQIAFAIFVYLNTKFNWGIELSRIRGFIGLSSMVFLAIGIYIGMEKSRRSNNGVITWGQAALTGIIIALIVAVISACGALIFNYLNPDFSERINSQSNGGFSPVTFVLQALIGQFFAGTMISLVMAIFIKRK